jgi:uncharacterized repeat protein (TIGR03803 family)
VGSVSVACLSNTTILYSFVPSTGDLPQTLLIQGIDLNFYGTAYSGGPHGYGAVFMLTPSGAESVLYGFGDTIDSDPKGALVLGANGNFYTTCIGHFADDSEWGAVVEVTPQGSETVLHDFGSAGDGAEPYAGLILASDGNFYGTTDSGGTGAAGTVFKITPGGSETVLYSFLGTPGDGEGPLASLIQGSDGNLYGTTTSGGTNNRGTVFRLTLTGTETVLYSFAGGTGDGAYPQASLIQGTDGNFYGTTLEGGTSNNGTVFKMTPGGVETVLYSFAGTPSDGASPEAGLIQASDGNFYGTTSYGGANNYGTVFEITQSGTETVLHSFSGAPNDGQEPLAPLLQGSDGNLYSTTYVGGANSVGTVFKVTLP